MPFVDLPFRLQPVGQIMTRRATVLLPKFVSASGDLFFHAGAFIPRRIENGEFVFHNNIPVRRRNNRSPIQRSRRSGYARPRCRKEAGARKASRKSRNRRVLTTDIIFSGYLRWRPARQPPKRAPPPGGALGN